MATPSTTDHGLNPSRPPMARLLDALALTILVVASGHEAMLWFRGDGLLTVAAWDGANLGGRIVGIVCALAAAYGVYLLVRTWRRVG
ncbi:hypothetical protein [Cupriavidus respiraculi]|nr:hypothetical protein [Cupriavidus respiraculi]